MNTPNASDHLKSVIVSPAISIAEAIARLDKAGTGALLLCDGVGHLKGLLTDGDIRRAILQGTSLDLPCQTIASLHPIIATAPVSSATALHLMNRHDVNHLPVVDAGGPSKLFSCGVIWGQRRNSRLVQGTGWKASPSLRRLRLPRPSPAWTKREPGLCCCARTIELSAAC